MYSWLVNRLHNLALRWEGARLLLAGFEARRARLSDGERTGQTFLLGPYKEVFKARHIVWKTSCARLLPEQAKSQEAQQGYYPESSRSRLLRHKLSTAAQAPWMKRNNSECERRKNFR